MSAPESFQSREVGVTQPACPIAAVADVRGTDARRRERDRPDGVAQGFQVSLYKVDPRVDETACNLLSKDFCRTSDAGKVVESGP
jgi:hypothetical protein